MQHPKSCPVSTRPREKLLKYGSSQLPLEELWMCVLGQGMKGKPVQVLSRQLVQATQELELRANNPELLVRLSSFLPTGQLARVLAIFELWQRWSQYQQRVFRAPKDALFLLPHLVKAQREQVVCLYLSAADAILRQETLAIGSWNAALLQPRDVFFPIRWLPVEAVVLCHNHPSGKLLPSDQDKRFTTRVRSAAAILGITLHDHIIVSTQGYFSFREAGLL